jgi:4-hydroxyphenylpyruvate dioxygenase
MAASLKRLVETVDPRKILLVQVVDAEYLAQQMDVNHPYYKPEQPARMSWSRNCRLFYGEHERGAYLPVYDILRAILVDLKFDGWISAELFNKSLADPSPTVPQDHAHRAAIAWEKIVADFGLNKRIAQPMNLAEAVRAQL